MRPGRNVPILKIVTKWESQAVLVLARGVFIRAGVHCPHCRGRMDARPEWRVKDSLIDWSYVCERCGTVLDTNLTIVSSLMVWGLPRKPAARSNRVTRGCAFPIF